MLCSKDTTALFLPTDKRALVCRLGSAVCRSIFKTLCIALFTRQNIHHGRQEGRQQELRYHSKFLCACVLGNLESNERCRVSEIYRQYRPKTHPELFCRLDIWLMFLIWKSTMKRFVIYWAKTVIEA